jgi:uncharacterized protein YutE (UPF0331/DUF86 family)
MSARADFLREECDNVEKTLVLIEELLGPRTLGKHEAAALGTYLHNTYSGVERLLRSLLDNREIRVASTPTWHKDLLQRAHREDLLSSDQFDGFLRLLAFRHVYVHGYSHMLDEERLREIAVPTPALVRAFLQGVRGKA